MSTVEAEYISAASCCTQLLWMKHHLEDYQINANNITIYCDNTAVICLSKNPILHSREKHIEIKHHFIRDYVQKGILNIQFIDTEHQWADIFTKPLTVERFDFIKKNLNMLIRMDTDLQESNILSNLIDDFPLICKQDPPDVRAHYVYEHWKATGKLSNTVTF